MRGVDRAPTSQRRGVRAIVEDFLGLVFTYDYEAAKKKPGVQREREIEAEIRGFNKAQEALRELIARYGTDPNIELAEVREKGQREPEWIGDRKVWFG